MWNWLWTTFARVRDLVWGSLFPAPPPPPPKFIPYDPTYVAAGPNLVRNGSFELGNFGPGTEAIVSYTGVIQDWGILVNAFNGPVRWIDTVQSFFSPAAEGKRFVDLTGGRRYRRLRRSRRSARRDQVLLCSLVRVTKSPCTWGLDRTTGRSRISGPPSASLSTSLPSASLSQSSALRLIRLNRPESSGSASPSASRSLPVTSYRQRIIGS